VAVTAACDRPAAAPSDTADPFHLALAYVDALHKGDAGRLRALSRPGSDADADIRKRLATYGSKNLLVERIVIGNLDISTSYLNVTLALNIMGTGTLEPHEEKLSMQLVDGRWYVNPGPP
jgi:hypothetical protein